jgi:RNA polymerase sigma factor (sigma-70 family)
LGAIGGSFTVKLDAMSSPESSRLSVAELYRSYGRKVFNLAYRMTGDRSVAEDVLQEVFVRIIKNYKRFSGASSVYTWIFAITKNVCLRTKQRTFRNFETLVATAKEPYESTSHDEIERHYYVRQVKDGCLTGLLRCLSFHQRVAFIMSVLYNVPTQTIAVALKKSANSVRILVSRAKDNLRTFLCKNCSLYDRANKCRCENMINFSLQHAWIAAYDSRTSPAIVEAELKEFKNEVLLYKSLSEQDPPRESSVHLLERKDLLILSKRKVK